MIVTDKTISDFRNIGIYKCLQIQNIPSYLSSFKVSNSQSQYTCEDIIDLRVRLQHLENNIVNYHPSFLRKILDILTGRYFRLSILKKNLPDIIEKVDSVVRRILEAFPNQYYLSEIDSEPIQRKIRLVELAQRHLNENFHTFFTPSEEETVLKVQRYFQNTLERLQHGENVPLPMWHHATRNLFSANSILQQERIKQNKAPCGTGAFISNNSEHQSYGDFVFVLDEENTLPTTNAHYFPPGFGSNAFYTSVWVCVYRDLPVTARTIAYVVTSDPDLLNNRPISTGQTTFIQKLRNAKIPLMDRGTSNLIHKIFETVNAQRDIPSRWKKSSRIRNFGSPMPTNMRHIQRQSTFWTSGPNL